MPRQVDHDARRAEVAALAATLVADRGIGVSVRDVAAEGGFSTTVVTHYFADKSDLLRQAYDSAVAAMTRRIEALEGGPDPLREHCATLLPLDAEAARIWRTWLAFFGAAVGDPDLAGLQRRRVRSSRRAVAELVAADASMRPGVDPDAAARELLALVHGIASEAAFDPDDWPAAAQLAPLDAALARLRS
jgi:AcrR family transcriptional regulator